MNSATEPPLSLRVRRVEGAAILHVAGSVDASSVQGLRSALFELVDEGHRRVVLDLSDVLFLDSSGLGAVVSTYARLRDAGNAFAVACPNDLVFRVFRLTGLDDALTICSTVEAALTA